MFPPLSQLVEDQPSGVGVLYVAPIKALLNNQAERLGLYTEMVGCAGSSGTATRRATTGRSS